MIHTVSGSILPPFASCYDHPFTPGPHERTQRLHLMHNKSVDHLCVYPYDIHLELSKGVATLLAGTSPQEKDLKTFPIHHYVELKANTYFNLIVHSDELVLNLIVPDTRPAMVKLAVPYLYQPCVSPFNVLEILDSYVSQVTAFHFCHPIHDYYELFYVMEGGLTLGLSEERYVLHSNDLIICGPNQSRTRHIICDAPCKYLTVVFNMRNAEQAHFLGQVFSCSTPIQSALNKLIAHSMSPSPYTQSLMLCHLQEIIIHLMQHSDHMYPFLSLSASQQASQSDLLQQIVAYMNQKVADPITIDEICHKFFISRSSLQALFKSHLHTSPKNYLINIKLQKSKELIQQKCHTISEISYLLGFSSIHYFSRVFKKYFNITPSEYAKQICGQQHPESVNLSQPECCSEKS